MSHHPSSNASATILPAAMRTVTESGTHERVPQSFEHVKPEQGGTHWEACGWEKIAVSLWIMYLSLSDNPLREPTRREQAARNQTRAPVGLAGKMQRNLYMIHVTAALEAAAPRVAFIISSSLQRLHFQALFAYDG